MSRRHLSLRPRRFVVLLAAIAGSIGCAHAGIDSGHWIGTIEQKRSSTALILDLAEEGGSRASLPDLALYDLPLVQQNSSGKMCLRATFHGQTVDAVLHRDGAALVGLAADGAEKATIRLRRSGPSEPLRYREESLTIDGNPKPIQATLFLPVKASPRPAVVLVHGSHGPSRGDLRGPAILFARSGIAALTYDKRDNGSDQSLPHRYSFSELAGDAVRAVNALARRPDIDRLHIGVWGISEGGWIAPAIASRSPLVRFVIAVSAPAVSYATVVDVTTRRGLARHGFSAPEIAQAIDAIHRVNDFVRHGGDRASLDAFLRDASRHPWAQAQGLPLPRHAPTDLEIASEVRWRELDHEPAAWWRSVHVPIFAVWGGDDDHPVAESVAAMRTALAAAGNRDATLTVYPHADHELFVRPGGGASWPRLAPGFIDAMTGWARNRAGLAQ
jgi:dienelactone hydrolase